MEGSRATENLTKGHHWVNLSKEMQGIYDRRFPTLNYTAMEGLTLGEDSLDVQTKIIFDIAKTIYEGVYKTNTLIALTRGFGITEATPKIPVVIFGKHNGGQEEEYRYRMAQWTKELKNQGKKIPEYVHDTKRVTRITLG